MLSIKILQDRFRGDKRMYAHHIDHHGKGVMAESSVEDEVEVEVGSLQPNQPGEWQVVVGVDSEVVDIVPEEDVLSKQPHHPGVRQVSVRVYDLEVEIEAEIEEVVEEIVLVVFTFPSYLQLKQSLHSTSSGSHRGTFSSTAITFWMTPSIPW